MKLKFRWVATRLPAIPRPISSRGLALLVLLGLLVLGTPGLGRQSADL